MQKAGVTQGHIKEAPNNGTVSKQEQHFKNIITFYNVHPKKKLYSES